MKLNSTLDELSSVKIIFRRKDIYNLSNKLKKQQQQITIRKS